jgi:hypothetical protein
MTNMKGKKRGINQRPVRAKKTKGREGRREKGREEIKKRRDIAGGEGYIREKDVETDKR